MILSSSCSRLKFKATLKGIVHFILLDLLVCTMPKRSSDQIVQNKETFPKEVDIKLLKFRCLLCGQPNLSYTKL